MKSYPWFVHVALAVLMILTLVWKCLRVASGGFAEVGTSAWTYCVVAVVLVMTFIGGGIVGVDQAASGIALGPITDERLSQLDGSVVPAAALATAACLAGAAACFGIFCRLGGWRRLIEKERLALRRAVLLADENDSGVSGGHWRGFAN